VGVGAILAEAALALLDEVLALLGFEVVVGDVHEFELNFEWQSILFLPQFIISVSKVTGRTFLTVVVFDEVLAELCFEQVA